MFLSSDTGWLTAFSTLCAEVRKAESYGRVAAEIGRIAGPSRTARYPEVQLLLVCTRFVASARASNEDWTTVQNAMTEITTLLPDPALVLLHDKLSGCQADSEDAYRILIDAVAVVLLVVDNVLDQTQKLTKRLESVSLTVNSDFPFAT